MTLRLVIFDMDGTLIDSGDQIAAAMRSAFEAEDLVPPTDAETRRIVGLELVEAVTRLAPTVTQTRHERIAEAYKRAFVAQRAAGNGEESSALFPGARDVLERLSAGPWQQNTLLGIATGKARRGLDHTLDAHGLRRYFMTTQTCSENPGKPHPGMIDQALRETGVERGDAVMIGDTVYDIEMAKNAGVLALGVAWGYHETQELRDAGASAVLSRFDELEDALSAHLP